MIVVDAGILVTAPADDGPDGDLCRAGVALAGFLDVPLLTAGERPAHACGPRCISDVVTTD